MSELSISIDLENVIVLKNKKNRGKGYSLNKAFEYALKNQYLSAITIDGDGQHDPREIYNFLKFEKKVDILIGKRNFSYPMPIHRRFSNLITSFILSIRSGVSILDSQCGYRKYNLNTLNKFTFLESGFNFESEVLIKVLSNGGSVDHINVTTIYNESKSHINKINDTLRFILLFFRSLFW